MTERTARAAADNNVQDVISAIDNYTCDPIRALAQTPPPDGTPPITETKAFLELLKRLSQRWPARGLRSAIQPAHYKIEDLTAAIDQCLDLPMILAKNSRTPSTVS